MKTVIEMAREAGAELAELPMADAIVFGVDDLEWNSAALQRFALLVRADEREACAQVCDELPAPDSCSTSEGSLWDVATLECGDAIRNRSST